MKIFYNSGQRLGLSGGGLGCLFPNSHFFSIFSRSTIFLPFPRYHIFLAPNYISFLHFFDSLYPIRKLSKSSISLISKDCHPLMLICCLGYFQNYFYYSKIQMWVSNTNNSYQIKDKFKPFYQKIWNTRHEYRIHKPYMRTNIKYNILVL